MVLFIPLLLGLFNFFLQSYPRFINKFFGVDVWTRLLEIEQVRLAGHRIPNEISKGFLIKGRFDYPIIFPFIFSFISKNKLIKIQGFVSPFFDSLHNLLVFFVAYQFTSSFNLAILAQTIYIFTPMVVVENSYLTPRSLGYTIFSLSFLSLLLFFIDNQIHFMILSILFSTLLFLTHRFALQSYIFICIFFFLFYSSYIFIIIPFFSFLLAILVTKGYYLRVLWGHLFNIYFWVINTEHRFAHQIYGTKHNSSLDWVGVIYILLSNFSPLFLFATNIWTISGFVFLYMFIKADPIAYDPYFFNMALWIIFFYIFGSVVLRIKKLIPIGEGQRYLEMATLPSSILSSYLIFHFYEIYGLPIIILGITIISCNLALIIFIQIKGIIKDKNRSLTREMGLAFNYINSIPGSPNIMCIPHQITTMTAYNTKSNVLVNADNEGLLKLKGIFPILTTPIDKIKEKFKLDYLIIKKSFAKPEDIGIKSKKVVFEESDILIVKL